MFVYPQRRKTQGAVALAVGALAIAACDDPTARTDLRPEGDPEVLAVLVLSDSLAGLLETATYCAPNDPNRPTLVGLPDFTTTIVCDEDPSVPATMAEAAPGGWYVRIMFDELLDPTIEDLIPILDENDMETGTFTGTLERTQPVTLRCKGVDDMFYNVPYDGYYSPSGNNVTWPVGPSLVIKPLDPTIVPVASDCEVTIKPVTVKDKDGNFVPDAGLVAFKFRTQPVTVIDTFPTDGGTVASDFMYFNDFEYIFNTVIDPDTFTIVTGGVGDVTLMPAEAGTAGTYGFDNLAFVFGDWTPGTEFTVEITADAKVTDLCGKETPLRVGLPSNATTFSTQPFRLNSLTPAQGTGILPSRKIRLDFNTPVLASSLDPATEITVTPAITGMSFVAPGLPLADGGTIIVNGRYQLNTEYTFTLKAGATVRDLYNSTDYTNAMDQTVKFTTAAAIALTAQSPANDARVVKLTPASNVDVRLTFSTEMDHTTVGPAEFTFTTAAGAPVAGVVVVPNLAPSTGITFRAAGLAAGSYVFTLKAGATINDLLGNTYTQAADRVIPFTVAEAPPPPPAEEFLCLGQTPTAAN